MPFTATTSHTELSIKQVTLAALVFQQVGLVLLIRYSKTHSSSSPYISSTAVLCAECLKFLINLTLELTSTNVRGRRKSTEKVWKELFGPETFGLLVPAFLYLIQNNLLFVALSNLSVPVYQVLNQGKLLTTALCSRIMLGKTLSSGQYVSLIILGLGVALVQLSGKEYNQSEVTSLEDGRGVGFVAMAISCLTSGFGGVYVEAILKKKPKRATRSLIKSTKEVSVYMRNCQLAFWSVLLGLVPVARDFNLILDKPDGFFQGYNSVVVAVIICQALTGLLVALVMKHADSILKGFATSIAVVLGTALSMFIWGSKLDMAFVVGAAMVLGAVQMYGNTAVGASKVIHGRKLSKSPKKSTSSVTLTSLIAMSSLAPFVFQIKRTETLNHLPRSLATTDMTLPAIYLRNFFEASYGSQCTPRDMSSYDTSNFHYPPGRSDDEFRKSAWSQCLRFECNRDHNTCDNAEPTNYDGPDPPCCVHVMRDMAQDFDKAMCELGLEYFPAFGMLLGLTRNDRLIPWTSDNDYIVTLETLMAMNELWESSGVGSKYGIGFLFDLVYRSCVTPSFRNGQLQKWQLEETDSWYADSVYPFADIFTMQAVNDTHIMDQRECYHHVDSLRPLVRKPVYDGSFDLNFPSNPESMLEEYFGQSWRVPQPQRIAHGGTHCGRRRARQKERAEKKKAQKLGKTQSEIEAEEKAERKAKRAKRRARKKEKEREAAKQANLEAEKAFEQKVIAAEKVSKKKVNAKKRAAIRAAKRAAKREAMGQRWLRYDSTMSFMPV